MRSVTGSSLSAIALLFALPAAAQNAGAQDPAMASGSDDDQQVIDEIVVTARSMRGTVDAPQPPVLELGAEEITAYGAGSIAELVTALGPQTSSGRGRGGGGGPAILVNGTRVSSFRELRSYPPESIERVEVFPEEVALRYGFSADQRVINFVLKDNFSSREIELEYGQPFKGGYSSKQAEATYLLIDGPRRYNINLQWEDASLLTEAERGVVQANSAGALAGDPDPAAYRSLSSDSSGFEITGNATTRLSDNGASLSLNATFERENTLRFQGLDAIELVAPDGTSLQRSFNAADPLTVDRRTDTYSLGSTLSMPMGDWQLTATVDGSREERRSLIQRRLTEENSSAYADLIAAAAAGTLPIDAAIPDLPDAGFDRANTRTDTANSLITVAGTPIWLPAGEVSVTFDGGFNFTRTRSEDTRNSGLTTRLKRGDLSAGVNVGVPITSVRDDFGAAIGDLTLNASAGVNHLSDFGTLTDWTLGFTWAPWELLTFNASYIAADAAPTLAQLGDPEIATPNEQIFDLVQGETVLATTISGGNPFLPAQRQRDWKIGAMLELPFLDRSNFSIDYFRNHSDDVAASFPVLTPEVEAAFPGRVIRDDSGRLVQVDQRPVTFAEQNSQRLQFGLNLSGPLGPEPVEEAGGGGPGFGRFGAAAASAAPATPAPERPAGGGFDRGQMLQLRANLCGPDAPTTPTPEMIAQMPEPLQQRLRGEDGQIDQERFAELRTRVCSRTDPATDRPAQPPANQAQGGGAGPMPGRGGRGGPGGGQGRWFANLQYTLELDNTILIAPGGPVLDLLDGDALTGGGQARHSASLRGGMFYRGLGGFANVTYKGASRLNGTADDLRFHDLLTFNLRMFADLNQRASLIEAVPALQNTRVSFSIDNIFDAQQRVTNASGDVPLRYQPALVDPVGRYFEIEFRKLF